MRNADRRHQLGVLLQLPIRKHARHLVDRADTLKIAMGVGRQQRLEERPVPKIFTHDGGIKRRAHHQHTLLAEEGDGALVPQVDALPQIVQVLGVDPHDHHTSERAIGTAQGPHCIQMPLARHPPLDRAAQVKPRVCAVAVVLKIRTVCQVDTNGTAARLVLHLAVGICYHQLGDKRDLVPAFAQGDTSAALRQCAAGLQLRQFVGGQLQTHIYRLQGARSLLLNAQRK